MNTKPKSQPQASKWWSSLDQPWQAIFKEAIGINSQPTADELVTILNLTQLNCSAKKLTSLEPLRALTGLQTLNCGVNYLTSLEPLRACPGLQNLECFGNDLTSLEPLRALTGLQTLICDNNHLTSLEPLQALPSLQILVCMSNHLTSLEPLQALTGLQKLYCGENHLTSLEPLQALTGLQKLYCGENHLTSLEPLQALTGLQTLGCEKNQLTNLEPLQACTGLQELDCSQNHLTSLEPLRACPDLQTLYCWKNQLTSLEPLHVHGLKTLNTLGCWSNPSLSQPEIERFWTNKKWFWWSSLDEQWQAIFKKAIRIKSEPTADDLAVILSLTTLNCSVKKLTSLEPLWACTGLQKLDCSGNQLTNLEPLLALTDLQTLNCIGNQLTSLEGLHGLKSLRKLDCGDNPLSQPEIERFQKAVPSCKVSSTTEDQRQREREDAKLIVPANNHFGFRLFDQLLQQDQGKNVFMSPASVAIALAMTYNGAVGHTQQAMAKTLGLENLSLEEVNTANLALRNVLLHQPDVSLLITNSLWLHQDFHLEPAFLTPTQQCYAANVTNADFQSPATVSNINQWVKENTQGKIGPVVQTLDPLTVLLVINAIYFKGRWEEPFDRRYTEERDFTLLTGENKRTPMMSQKSFYDYYKGYNYQSVCLPYRGAKKQRFSMTIFLPDRGTPLSNFLLRDHWQEWRTGCNFRKGTIVLPRFKVESEVTLNEVLKRLGMAEAFSVDQANFSQMAKVPKGQNLYLSEVKHQTFVEVNEEGTEAAAVTTVEECDTGRALIPRPFEMIVNHPFFFTIQDDGTGTVVFMGAIVEPK